MSEFLIAHIQTRTPSISIELHLVSHIILSVVVLIKVAAKLREHCHHSDGLVRSLNVHRPISHRVYLYKHQHKNLILCLFFVI